MYHMCVYMYIKNGVYHEIIGENEKKLTIAIRISWTITYVCTYTFEYRDKEPGERGLILVRKT